MSHPHNEVVAPAEDVAPATDATKFETIPYRAKGDAEGFKFTAIQFDTLTAASAHFTEQTVLDLFNGDIASRMGLTAKNKAFGELAKYKVSDPKRGQARQQLITKLTSAYPNMVIFSADDASKWRPGVKELSMIALTRKFNEAMGAGDVVKATEYLNAIQEAAKRQMAEVEAQGA